MSSADDTPRTPSATDSTDSASASASATCSGGVSYPEFKKWEDVDEISPDLLRGIYAYGFENPSNIQQKSIMSIIHKRDVIAQAQSGTGKISHPHASWPNRSTM